MKKSGITLVSIVLYVVLFFIFSTFAIMFTSNYNIKVLTEKGNIWVNEQASKIEYNILNSAKSSSRADIINQKIIFSNNDEYYYEAKTKRVLKNGQVIANDVTKFSIIDTSVLKNASKNLLDYPDSKIENVAIRLTIKKYTQTKEFEYFVTLGGI